jgi:hypothetical protein
MEVRTSRGGFDQSDTSEIERATSLSARQFQQKFFQATERDRTLNMNEFDFPGAENQRDL